jgi:energy-coupling factor transport system permease protein
MNARALAAWSASGLCIALATNNPVYRAFVLLCAVNLVLARGTRRTRLRTVVIGVGLAGLTSTVLTVLLSHTGTHVLVRIDAGIPAIGGTLTLEALAYGASTGIGIAGAVLAVAPLGLLAEAHDIAGALPRVLARTGAAIGTSLNLIPAVARSAAEIRDAQRMRGWRARRVREWPDLAVPIVLTAIESSTALAEAMEARGYGGARRTHFALTRWTGTDVIVAVTALLAAAAFIALRGTGLVADWYPFPSLTAPSVGVPGVLCCVILALPSLTSRT